MKRFLTSFLKIAVSSILVALVLWKIGPARLGQEIRAARPGLLMLGVGVFVLSNVLGALQWNLLLRAQGIRLTFRKALSFYFVGVFFNNFLISNIGGDAIRVYDAGKLSGQGSRVFAATFLDRFVGLLVLIGFSLAAYPFCPGLEGHTSVIATVLILAGGFAGVLIVGFSRRAGGHLERLLCRILPARGGEVLSRIRESLLLYRSEKALLARVLGLSAGIQVLRVAVHYTVGHALGAGIAFPYFLVFVPLAGVVASLPISFGGLGVQEGLVVVLFRAIGVPGATAFSIQFLARVVCLVGSAPGGILFALRGAARRREDAETRR